MQRQKGKEDRHGERRKLMRCAVVVLSVLFAACAVAAETSGYSCSMRVGNPDADESVSKGGTKKSGGAHSKKSVTTKVSKRSVSWPVTVSIHGASVPPSDKIKLKCYFIGTTDGRPELLGEKTLPVTLDEKGRFKADVESPAEKLVHKTIKTSRVMNVRSGAHIVRRSVPSGTKSETSGSRVTGCIIQLVVNGKVEKSYASNPGWTKFAKTDPVPIQDVLKIR